MKRLTAIVGSAITSNKACEASSKGSAHTLLREGVQAITISAPVSSFCGSLQECQTILGGSVSP